MCKTEIAKTQKLLLKVKKWFLENFFSSYINNIPNYEKKSSFLEIIFEKKNYFSQSKSHMRPSKLSPIFLSIFPNYN